MCLRGLVLKGRRLYVRGGDLVCMVVKVPGIEGVCLEGGLHPRGPGVEGA